MSIKKRIKLLLILPILLFRMCFYLLTIKRDTLTILTFHGFSSKSEKNKFDVTELEKLIQLLSRVFKFIPVDKFKLGMGRCLAFTVDDGLSDYMIAHEIFRINNITPYLFVTKGFAEGYCIDWPSKNKILGIDKEKFIGKSYTDILLMMNINDKAIDNEYLTTKELIDLVSVGEVILGGHGEYHLYVSKGNLSLALTEFENSLEFISSLGQNSYIRYYAFPNGTYDDVLIDCYQQKILNGFLFTQDYGINLPHERVLKRIQMNWDENYLLNFFRILWIG